MSLESVNRLAELTGKNNRTVKNRLEELVPIIEGRSHLYESKEALPLLYQVDAIKSDELDLQRERARLAHHQANKTALEEKTLSGELVPADEIRKAWGDAMMAFRSRVLALPPKLAKAAINAESVKEIERSADALIREALAELAIYGDS